MRSNGEVGEDTLCRTDREKLPEKLAFE